MLVNNVRLAKNPITGQILPVTFIGLIVPGSGDLTNGMVTQDEANYPDSFRDQAKPLFEPRLGFGYNLFGNGKTALLRRWIDEGAVWPEAINPHSALRTRKTFVMKKALHLKFVLSLAVVGLLAVTFVAVRHNTSAATATPAASNEQTENHRDRIQTQPVSIQMEVARKL